MKLRLNFLFTLIVAIIVRFPVIWCQDTRPYDVCGQSVQCGDFRLDYPFWGSGRPAYCGHSGFQLTCKSNITLLNYQSVIYRVLHMNTSSQSITIARDDFSIGICSEYIVHDTSYNSTLFNDNNIDQENVSLYFRCDSSIEEQFQYMCDVNGTENGGFFNMTNRITSDVTECKDSIVVPVNRSSAARLATRRATSDDLISALKAGFSLNWVAKNVECDKCIRSKGRCGSNSTSPELFACYCENGNFSLICSNIHRSMGSTLKIIIGISSFMAGVLFIVLAILYQRKRLLETHCDLRLCRTPQFMGTSRNHQIEVFIRDNGTMTTNRFTYSEIKKMTNLFAEKLGEGGFGSVYKGQLPDGQLVAVKLLDKAMGDGQDFINEVASISRTSHVNVVTLLGFCFDGKKRALIYEFMPNGSLDKFLCPNGSRLDWNTLFQIAKGIARGLEYLHRGCNTRIVHFDIKPHNILLDEEFIPKISDFGLAKLCKRKESIVTVTGARGTAGYMAPEVFFRSLGGASHKSDVYSYGMMVLEMTGARKDNAGTTTDMSETYFPDTVYKKVEGGESLGVVGVATTEDEELARKMVMVSLWCIQSDPSDRPSISKVVEMLEGSFQSLQVPPKRFWSSPIRSSQGISPSTTRGLSDERALTMQAVGEGMSSNTHTTI